MLINNPSITEKNYRKLTLLAAPEGFAFCVFDTLDNKVVSCHEVNFDVSDKLASVEISYAKAFDDNPELSQQYDEILVLHNNNFSTMVPQALFDADYLGSYMQYGTKVFETDFFDFDEISAYHMNLVYIPYANINNFLVDKFSAFDYRHAHTILVSKLLEASKFIDDKRMFVHINPGRFEVVVVQNQHLLLFNSFEYKTPGDLIYYLLFTAEQLNMNPENFRLEFLGVISEDDDYFNIAYKYIRNVSLFDTQNMGQHHDFSASENRKNFILLHS